MAEERRWPHADTVVAGRGLVLVVARHREDLAAVLRLRREWNELTRDPEDVGRDLARFSFRIPVGAINAYGHAPPVHLVHEGRHTQEVLDFQPCGMTESEVRREMERRLRALARHGLL